MGTSNNTLRSQTVRCPHCGEYYSVTYKYCPFCDAGRQEEERRQAAKKKKKQALFSSLFGGDSEKKKGSKDSRRDSEHTERTRRERPAREESAGRSAGTSKDQREHPAKDHGSRDHSSKGHSAKETAAKDPLLTTRRHGHRKKTSEMTPEERAASLAEREARAAARKRERDRLAREAALNALETTPAQEQADAAPVELPVVDGVSPQETPVEAGPVFEEVTVPETFGYSEETADPAPADPAQAGQEGMSQTMIFIPPIPTAPEEEAKTAPEPEETVWDSVKDLQDAADVPEITTIPPMTQEQVPEVQVGQEAQPVPPTEPQQEAAPAEPAAATEEDLDALLSEIRDLLAESPVPSLDAQQIEKPAAPVEEVQLQQEPEGQEAPAAPAQEVPAQESVPVVDEPTIALDPLSPAEEVQADGQEEVPADAVDTAPTQVIPSQAIEEELAAQTEKGWAEEELPAAVRPPRQAVPQSETAARREERRGDRKEKKKSGRGNLVLLVVSLIIVVAAAFIVVRTVVPAFQNGIFSGSTQAAESVTLDRTTLDLAEAGTTIALVPTFAPEGATAALTWASSDEAVATVDENGNVTAVAPGSAVISATMENGQKAECTVNCTWDADAEGQAPEEGGEDQETAPAGPSLSSTDMTLDSEGASKQLTLNGAAGEVTWTSSDESVATVAADGTVTAVAPGRATVTATVGEQTFNCTIRCIW